MIVRIKIIKSRHTLELKDDATTNDLFKKIETEFKVPIEQQKLLSGGKKIPRDSSLLCTYLKSNKPVMVMGAKPPPKKKTKKFLQAPVLEELDIDDVIAFVFSFFKFDDVIRYSKVCKSWRDIADRGSIYNADRYTFINGYIFDMFNYNIVSSFQPKDLKPHLSSWFHHLSPNASLEIFQQDKSRNSLLLYTKIDPSPETFYSEQFGTVNIYFPYFLICLSIPEGSLKWIQPIQSMVENLPVNDSKKILDMKENQEENIQEDDQEEYVIINGSTKNIFRPAKFICNDRLGIRRKSWNNTHPNFGRHNNLAYLVFANQCILSFNIDNGRFTGGYAPRPHQTPHIIYEATIAGNNLVLICGNFIFVLDKNTLQLVHRISYFQEVMSLIAQTDDSHFITATADSFLILNKEGLIIQEFFQNGVVLVTDNELLLTNGQIFSMIRDDYVRIPGLNSNVRLIYEENNRVEGVLEYSPKQKKGSTLIRRNDNDEGEEEEEIEFEDENEDLDEEMETNHPDEPDELRRESTHSSQVKLWAIFRDYTTRYKRQGKVILENMEMIECWNISLGIPFPRGIQITSYSAFINCQRLFVGAFLSPPSASSESDHSLGSCLVVCMDRNGEKWRSDFSVDWRAFCDNPAIVLSEAGRLVFVNVSMFDLSNTEYTWMERSCTVVYDLATGYCCGSAGDGCHVESIPTINF